MSEDPSELDDLIAERKADPRFRAAYEKPTADAEPESAKILAALRRLVGVTAFCAIAVTLLSAAGIYLAFTDAPMRWTWTATIASSGLAVVAVAAAVRARQLRRRMERLVDERLASTMPSLWGVTFNVLAQAYLPVCYLCDWRGEQHQSEADAQPEMDAHLASDGHRKAAEEQQ